MTRFLSLEQVYALHAEALRTAGGNPGIRDAGGAESAVAQPQMMFGGEDFYPALVDKAAALGFSLIKNHAFIGGNKRVGHAPMEVFLVINGHKIGCDVDEQERVIKSVAAGTMGREEFTEWVRIHARAL